MIRRNFLLLIVGLLAFTLVSGGIFLLTTQPKPALDNPAKISKPLAFRASIPYWDQEKAFASFKSNVSKFDHLSLFWYYLNSEGKIQPYQYAKEDKTIIDFAHKNGIKVGALIANLPDEDGSWDSQRVEKVIANPEARKKHIADIVTTLERLNFDGVNIDYEQVDQNQKDNFSLFIKELKEELSKKGKFVGVALHPKTAERKKGEEIGWFQDWKALAGSADQLYIMAYGEHWDESPAGPIASEGWIRQIISYVESLNLPRENIFLGTPLYGYAWPKGSNEAATGLTFEEIQAILRSQSINYKWDEKAKAPFFTYIKSGQEYEVWFENSRSLDAKVRLAYEAGLAGVSFWRLGGEDPLIWDTIRASY